MSSVGGAERGRPISTSSFNAKFTRTLFDVDLRQAFQTKVTFMIEEFKTRDAGKCC